MPIYFGSNKIKEIYNNGTKIKEVYYGSSKVFSGGTIKYHTVTPETAGVGMGGGVTFYPSFDTGTKLVSVQPPIMKDGKAYYVSSNTLSGFYITSYTPQNSLEWKDLYYQLPVTMNYIDTVVISNIKFERYSLDNSPFNAFIPEGFIINQSGILYTQSDSEDGFINLGSRPQSTFTINNTTYTITGTKEIDILKGEIK